MLTADLCEEDVPALERTDVLKLCELVVHVLLGEIVGRSGSKFERSSVDQFDNVKVGRRLANAGIRLLVDLKLEKARE